ncbi:hypothetical protein R1sor_019847 [Riccia sorocarpa]|uniref:Uncharacterized protein n=1 Tax=Riccia sorocarpa TaxID=122646 RepID=A0ABD3IHH5_9MARC
MVPGRVILPEEWEVWDAVIPVTWPALRNPNDSPCYARRGTGVSHTQTEGTLLQDPRVTPSNVQDSSDCEDGDIEETPAVRRLLGHLVRVSGRPRKQADVSIKGTARIGTCTEETASHNDGSNRGSAPSRQRKSPRCLSGYLNDIEFSCIMDSFFTDPCGSLVGYLQGY